MSAGTFQPFVADAVKISNILGFSNFAHTAGEVEIFVNQSEGD